MRAKGPRTSASKRSTTPGVPAARNSGARQKLILVLGGSASGKSQYALDLAGSSDRRVFVATGQALDHEMAKRIKRHRESRGHGWTTAEVPVDLVQWFEKESDRYQTIVLDCLTLWLSNLIGRGTSEDEAVRLSGELIRAMRPVKGRVIVVTNELGMGLVPMEVGARNFRDVAGRVNQQFAEVANEVHMVVSGIAVRIK